MSTFARSASWNRTSSTLSRSASSNRVWSTFALSASSSVRASTFALSAASNAARSTRPSSASATALLSAFVASSPRRSACLVSAAASIDASARLTVDGGRLDGSEDARAALDRDLVEVAGEEGVQRAPGEPVGDGLPHDAALDLGEPADLPVHAVDHGAVVGVVRGEPQVEPERAVAGHRLLVDLEPRREPVAEAHDGHRARRHRGVLVRERVHRRVHVRPGEQVVARRDPPEPVLREVAEVDVDRAPQVRVGLAPVVAHELP